ncbi:PQ loop repeat-domain-containing protein [Russula dissimulans]|nr:PQ loop repeat-domain-containing protein [Russula dissimulans]
MPVNAVAENVFGTMGAIFWSIQLIPQLIKSWRTKSTKGLSPWLVFLWGIAALPLGVYVIVQDLNIPLICLYYDAAPRRSRAWCALVLGGTLALWGTLEAAFVFALRPSYRRGTRAGKAGVRFFGILSSTLISVAILPQYYEIYKYRAVLGISLPFMFIDLLGGVFSILSLVFKRHFDVLAAVAYALVVVMDGLVLVLAVLLHPCVRNDAHGGEQRSRGGASDGADGTATAVVPTSGVPHNTADAEKDPVADYQTPTMLAYKHLAVVAAIVMPVLLRYASLATS